jgi:uncharacterized membrane protein YphA (DoxX/SURF4 family)
VTEAVSPGAGPFAKPLLIRACRIGVGLVMLAAALGKIGDPGAFSSQIHHFHLTPVGAENLIAVLLPWVELVVGLSLALGLQARSGAWLGFAMMIVFTIAVGSALARGLNIECGCFGTASSSRVGGMKIAENLVLTGASLVASLRLR